MIDRDRALIERVLGDHAIRFLTEWGSLGLSPQDIAALLSAARDEGRAEGLGGWEPIETAPRDGTTIDLFANGYRIADCFWGRPEHECGEAGQYCDSCPSVDGWVDSTFNHQLADEESPTHWRLPPAPPASQTQEG